MNNICGHLVATTFQSWIRRDADSDLVRHVQQTKMRDATLSSVSPVSWRMPVARSVLGNGMTQSDNGSFVRHVQHLDNPLSRQIVVNDFA
jgi:hypothetical protein